MAIGDGQVMDRVRSFLLEPTFANQEGMKPEDVARRRAMAEALWSQGHSTQPVVGVFDGMNRVLQSFLGGRQLRQAEAADQSIRARDEADQVAGLNAMADFAFPNQTSGGVPGASQGWPATGTQQTGLTPVAGDGDFTGTAWRPGQPAGALTPDGVASAGGGNYRDAISGIESGGDYSLLGPVANASGDRAYGRYQVMGENVGPWTEQVLGRRMTPQEFLADPAAQDAVFDSIFGGYVQRYGPEGAARAWFTGSPTGTGTDVLGTTADHYVEMFRNGGGTAITAASATGTATTANPTRAFVDSLIANPATRPYAAQILQDQITVLMTPPAPADPYTLGPNETRFDGNNQPVAQGGAATPTPTDDIREYNLAVQQGETRSFTEWDAARRRAAAPNYYENRYDAVTGEGDAGFRNDLLAGERNAYGQIERLNLMERQIDDPAFYSGAGADLVAGARRIGIALGITDPNAVQSIEQFISLSNQQILDQIGGSLGTAISNGDRDFIAQTAANRAYTPDGNRSIITIQRALAQRAIEVGQMARQYEQAHGRIDSGFYTLLAQYAEANPLFGGAPGAGIDGTPPAASPAAGAATAAPPGAVYADPGNAIFIIPVGK